MLRAEPLERVETLPCPHCGGRVRRVYGELVGAKFGPARRLGVYSADFCVSACGPGVVLAIGAQEPDEVDAPRGKVTLSLRVWPAEREFQMQVLEAEESPWLESGVLGLVLGREEALIHPLKEWFFHAADHVVQEDARVHAHLAGDAGGDPGAPGGG